MEPADISIYIPVRNGENFIETAIKSVMDQTISNWKLIIKDNFSSDDTCEIVRRYTSDPRIVLVERNHDVGMYENGCSCVRDVDTKYYMLLSHDDYLFSHEALEKAYRILEAHSAIPKVHSDMAFVDRYSKSIITKHFGREGCVDSDSIGKKSIITVRNLYGIPLLIRSSAVRGHQYDKAFPYTSDIDFSIAVGKGQCIYHIPEVLIAIRFHQDNATHGRFDQIAKELRLSAKKNQIELSIMDRWLMIGYDHYQRIAKKIFYFYLNHFR